MSEIKFNSIYDGVTLAIHAAFPDRQVHGGDVKQGLKPGDFNVVMPGAGHTKEVGQRYRRTPTVDVIYYPQSSPYSAECNDVADALTRVLGSIQTPQGDMIHATACEWRVDEGVFHMLLSYDHHIYIPQTPEPMETLKIEQRGIKSYG